MKLVVGVLINLTLTKLILLPCHISSGLFSVCLLPEFHTLAADVPFRVSALTSSCVVVPCSFQYPEDTSLTRGIWAKKNGGVIYHNARSETLDHFKGRTKLLGDLNEGNCSLEINDIYAFDNGPFCFHAEKGKSKYKFNDSCVFIVMKGINVFFFFHFFKCYLTLLLLPNQDITGFLL